MKVNKDPHTKHVIILVVTGILGGALTQDLPRNYHIFALFYPSNTGCWVGGGKTLMCVFSRFLFVFNPNKHVYTQIFAYPEVSKLVVARLMGFSQNSFTPAILSIISVTIQCKQSNFSF